MTNHRSSIGIKTIQREFLISYVDLLAIIKSEGWKTTDKTKLIFDRETVYSYFARKGVDQQTIDWKSICSRYGVEKADVFDLIKKQKWRPVTTGKLWTFPLKPIAEYFSNNKQK